MMLRKNENVARRRFLLPMIFNSSLARSLDDFDDVANVVMLMSAETSPLVEFLRMIPMYGVGISRRRAMSAINEVVKLIVTSAVALSYSTRYGVLKINPSRVDFDETDTSSSMLNSHDTGRSKPFPARSSTSLTVNVTLFPVSSEN